MGDDAGRSLSCFRSRVVFQVVEQPASKTKCTNEACLALQQILSISGGRSPVFVLLCIVGARTPFRSLTRGSLDKILTHAMGKPPRQSGLRDDDKLARRVEWSDNHVAADPVRPPTLGHALSVRPETCLGQCLSITCMPASHPSCLVHKVQA